MNENENRTEGMPENECDFVRFALFNSEPLTDKQKKHIEECEICRTFRKQAETVFADLKEISKDFNFDNKNSSVCDRVMDEIKRQEVFTGKNTVKTNPFFKHSGLIAACLVIAVMAVPVLKGTFLSGSKNEEAIMFDAAAPEFSQYSDNELPKNAKLYGVSADSGAVNGTGSNDFFEKAEEESVPELDTVETHTLNDSINEAYDGTVYMFSAEAESVATQNSKDDTLKSVKEFKSSGSSVSMAYEKRQCSRT